MPRRKSTPSATPFVVYVTFTSGGKEYAYLCDDPSVVQGSRVIANGASVEVRRTASSDPRATRYVTADRTSRIREIMTRLDQLVRAEEYMKRYSSLTSPEAKRLVRELKELSR